MKQNVFIYLTIFVIIALSTSLVFSDAFQQIALFGSIDRTTNTFYRNNIPTDTLDNRFLVASGLQGFNGTTWDRLKATAGVLQTSSTVSGTLTVIGNSTPADGQKNPTDTLSTWNHSSILNDATGNWDRQRNAGNDSQAATGLAGAGSMVFNGATWDRIRNASADGLFTTSVGNPASSLMVYNQSTNVWDRLRGGTATALTTGTLSSGTYLYDTVNGTWNRLTTPLNSGDAATFQLTGIPSATWIYNGTNWDRQRTASADTLAATGLNASGQVVYNGATWDRQRGNSNTTLTETTSIGHTTNVPLSTWSITNTPAAATKATVSKAAGGGTVKHVATGFTICSASSGTAQTAILAHVRDGATGAGTILRSVALSHPVNTSACQSLQDMAMIGTANTAMTIEFAAAGVAASQQTVTLTGFSVP